MTVLDYLAVFRKRWTLVVAGLLLGLLVSSAASFLVPREYTARATLYISAQLSGDNAALAYQGSLLSEQRAKSYAELLESQRVANEVVQRLQLAIDPRDLAREIQASAPTDTVLLYVTVTDQSAERAAMIANTASDVFVGLVSQIEQPSDPRQAPTVTAKIVENASPPEDASYPQIKLNLALGLLAGLAAGAAAALLANALDRTVRSVELLALLTSSPSLGSVPAAAGAQSELNFRDGSFDRTVESFRKLTTNLRFLDVDRPAQVLVCTSAVAGEGKTSVSLGLAAAATASGMKVAVIDADLRRPRVAAALGLEDSVGLTSVLASRIGLAGAVQRAGDGYDVLASGVLPPNPADLLGSERFSEVLAVCRDTYDLVVVDSPPVLPVADTLRFVAQCDGSLFVVRYGKTRRADVELAATSIRSVQGRLLGAVLNSTPVSGTSSAYYYQSDTKKPYGPSLGSDHDVSPHRAYEAGRAAPGGSPTPRPRRQHDVPPGDLHDATTLVHPRDESPRRS